VNNQWFSKVAVWLVIALVLFTVFKQFDRGVTAGNQIGYSDFLEEVRGKRIKSVTLQENSSRSRCRRTPAVVPRSSPPRPTTSACAAPPPTWTVAWSAT